MDHFLKRFTVIDFLGIFVPGGIAVLAAQYFFGGITEPFTRFFSDQSVTLVIYFVFLSYLVGIGFQEMSKVLEPAILWRADGWHKYYQEDELVRAYYESCFGKPISNVRVETAEESPYLHVWKEIYHYIQPQLEQSKVPLFHAFASMGRNTGVVAIAVAVMGWVSSTLPGGDSWTAIAITFACLIVLGLMWHRCERFNKTIVEYTYILFIAKGNAEKKENAQK